MSERPFADWPVISVYTRADALADGDLVAAEPSLLHEVGVAIPVAYTRSAYADTIEWTDTDALYHGALQDRTGREHDVLMLLRAAMGRARSSFAGVVHRRPRPPRWHVPGGHGRDPARGVWTRRFRRAGHHRGRVARRVVTANHPTGLAPQQPGPVPPVKDDQASGKEVACHAELEGTRGVSRYGDGAVFPGLRGGRVCSRAPCEGCVRELPRTRRLPCRGVGCP